MCASISAGMWGVPPAGGVWTRDDPGKSNLRYNKTRVSDFTPTWEIPGWLCVGLLYLYTYGQTDGNPMIEPVRLPALRVHDGRARSVQRSDAMVNGRFDEKGPLIGDVARHVDDGAVSFGFQVLFVL